MQILCAKCGVEPERIYDNLGILYALKCPICGQEETRVTPLSSWSWKEDKHEEPNDE